MMRLNPLGRSTVKVSQISFGCGGTAGLMVRGTHEEQCSVVEAAIAAGINVFDTSPTYGGGHSETNLGAVLKSIGAQPLIGTKIDFREGDLEDLEGCIERSIQRSQERLGRERLDILYLHSRVGRQRDLPGRVLSVNDVLGPGGVADIMKRLKQKGVIGATGFTALGHTDSIRRVLDSTAFDCAQIYYNLLNPSAGAPTVAAWRAQDYEEIIPRAAQLGVGVVGIRALAAGALSDAGELHRFAKSYSSLARSEVDADRVKAQAFRALVPGGVSMAQFALQFALSEARIDTILIGISERSHLDEALTAYRQGPLEAKTLHEIDQRFRDLYEMA
jgi:aryl-alcohol dehydrogenase-like predicted oxidoreductase